MPEDEDEVMQKHAETAWPRLGETAREPQAGGHAKTRQLFSERSETLAPECADGRLKDS